MAIKDKRLCVMDYDPANDVYYEVGIKEFYKKLRHLGTSDAKAKDRILELLEPQIKTLMGIGFTRTEATDIIQGKVEEELEDV